MAKAYVISHQILNDADRFMTDYASKVPDTLKPFGGRFLVRSGNIFYREGEDFGDSYAVVEFPDRDAALAWQSGEQYQAILPARMESSAGTFVIIDGVPE